MSTPFYLHTPDGSVVGANGQVVIFSIPRFKKDICEGDCCFVCGATPDSKPFNDEHVLPRWLLKRHGLFDQQITLPNGRSLQYGRYTIPCCAECNSLMGNTIEKPIAALFDGGHEAVAEHLRQSGPELLFRWMALVFIKTHLKDTLLRWNHDPRVGDEAIGDVYDWEGLHHVHCVARAFRAGVRLGEGAIGSFVALPAIAAAGHTFDYGDFYDARSLLIRSGDVALIAVLNDSCGALSSYMPELSRITGPLSPPQLREVLASLAHRNLSLKNRPKFSTVLVDDGFEIQGEVPAALELEWCEAPSYGDLLHHACRDFLPAAESDVLGVREGRWSYLFDGDRNFIDVRSLMTGEVDAPP